MCIFGTRSERVELIGGAACLDFTNTASARGSSEEKEYLADYTSLAAWSCHAGILEEECAQQLVDEARRQPGRARATLMRALRLREALYRIFLATTARQTGHPSDLALLNAELVRALPNHALVQAPGNSDYVFEWRYRPPALDAMLGPIVSSAADLLTAVEIKWVSRCRGDACGWLFLDSSKNHSRRWCSMSDCGNRAKAHRHYRRLKRNRGSTNKKLPSRQAGSAGSRPDASLRGDRIVPTADVGVKTGQRRLRPA